MKQFDSDEPMVRTTTLAIAELSCGACVRHVTRALDGLTGVIHVNVDVRASEASVEHLPAFVGAASLIAAIRDEGYAARVVHTVDDIDTTLLADASAACGCGCCRLQLEMAAICDGPVGCGARAASHVSEDREL